MILVAHSYYLRYDEKQLERMKPYPPLATLIAAAVLRDAGHPVDLFDAMLAPGVEAFGEQLRRVRPAVVALVEDSFNFLTKMCTLRMRAAALQMVAEAREAGCRVVVSGSDAADHPELYLAAGAHAVLLGEPEASLRELAAAWSAGHEPELAGIAGLAWRRGDQVARSAPRAGVRDLDALPLPAWDLVDAEAYREAWHGAHGRLSWNMATSRGCPFGCNWCAKPVFGRRYAQRSAASVAEEMRRLKDTVAPDHLWFADDIFGLTAAWIAEFADEVERRDARIPFMMQSRVDLMRPDTVAALARAGAEEVWMGVESGSQKILDLMEKGTAVDEVLVATRALRAGGIRACWFIQLGYLSEEWDDILLTRDLIRDGAPDDIGVSVAYPLPGTKFHEQVREQLGDKRNWSDTDDLAMLFQGRFSTAFYRRVRDLLHQEVRTGAPARGWSALARAARGPHAAPPRLTAVG